MVLEYIRLPRSWTTDCWTVFSNSLDSDTDNPMSFRVSPDFWIVISSSVRLEPDSSVMTIWSVSCIIASCCGG